MRKFLIGVMLVFTWLFFTPAMAVDLSTIVAEDPAAQYISTVIEYPAACDSCHTVSGMTDKMSSVGIGDGVMRTKYVNFHSSGFERKHRSTF